MEIKGLDKQDVVQSPADTIVKGEILEVGLTTWTDHLKDHPDRLKKFDNPEQQILTIRAKVEWEGENLAINDTVPYSEKPTNLSKQGRLLEKYGQLNVGTQVMIIFDGKGIGKLHVK